MVIYDLECTLGHRFEGWFPDSSSFDRQRKKGHLACAVCGLGEVSQIPSGGHVVGLASGPPAGRVEAQPVESQQQKESKVDPVVWLKAVHRYVKGHFKDVGPQFSQKAIAMHRGDEPAEAIHGQATPTEREEMDSEEVPYSIIPRIPENFEN